MGLDEKIISMIVPTSACRYTLLAIFQVVGHGLQNMPSMCFGLIRNNASTLNPNHRIGLPKVRSTIQRTLVIRLFRCNCRCVSGLFLTILSWSRLCRLTSSHRDARIHMTCLWVTITPCICAVY